MVVRNCGIFWRGWQLSCAGAEGMHQVKADRQKAVEGKLGQETVGPICYVPIMSKVLC